MPEWLHLEMIAGAAVYSLLGTVLFAVLLAKGDGGAL